MKINKNIVYKLLTHYNLNCNLVIISTTDKGYYNPLSNTIFLNDNYKNNKDFLMTVLHEIKHALDSKNLGADKFFKKYNQASLVSTYYGLDAHDNNKWEIRAEKWAIHKTRNIQ